MDDISVFGDLFDLIMEMMETEFVLFGFTLSLWQIAVWDVVASVFCFFVYHAFWDD